MAAPRKRAPAPGQTLGASPTGGRRNNRQNQPQERMMVTPRDDAPEIGETLGLERRRRPQPPQPPQPPPPPEIERPEAPEAPEPSERQRQLREALAAVEPFQTDSGDIDLVAAIDGGVPTDALRRLGATRADIQRARDIAAVRPFETDGRVDVAAALEAGVPGETLERLGLPSEIQEAEDLEIAAPEPASIELPAIQEPPEPSGPQMPEPPDTLDARTINALRREVAHAQNAVLRSVAPGQDTANQQRLARLRINEFWSEFRLDVAGLRERFESRLRWFPRAISSAQGHIADNLADARRGRISQETAEYRNGLWQARIDMLREQEDGARQEQRDFDRFVRDLQPVIQETISDSFENIPRITENRTGVDRPAPQGRSTEEIRESLGQIETLGDVQQALEEGRVDRQELVSLGFSNEQIGRAMALGLTPGSAEHVQTLQQSGVSPSEIAQITQRAAAERRAREEVLERIGGTVEEAAEALREGRITEEELASNLTPASAAAVAEAASREPESLPETPQIGAFGLPEEDLPASRDRIGDLQQRIREVGVTEAMRSGFTSERELEEVFGAEQIERLQQEELAFDRTTRQAFAPGRDLAMDQLRQEGLADETGAVNVIRGVELGRHGLLGQAGFTPEQIQQAETDLENIRIAEAGGQPVDRPIVNLPVAAPFPTAPPVTTQLATDEAIEAARQRQEEIDQELMGLRGLIRQADEGLRGPDVRAQAERTIERLAEEKTALQDEIEAQLVDQFQNAVDAFEALRERTIRTALPGDPEEREAIQDAIDRGEISLDDLQPTGGAPAFPVPGLLPVPRLPSIPGLPQVQTGTGPTIISALIGAGAITAEVLRRNPGLRERLDTRAQQILESVQREQVTPEAVSPPGMAQQAEPLELPGIALGRPAEFEDVAPPPVERPTLPGTARELVPEAVTVLNQAAATAETESDIRRQFPGDVPGSVEEFLRRPEAAEPTIAVPIDELVRRALADPETAQLSELQRARLRDSLADFEIQRRILADARQSFVSSQQPEPQSQPVPEVGPAPTMEPETTIEQITRAADLQQRLSLSQQLQSQLAAEPDTAIERQLAQELERNFQRQQDLQRDLARSPSLAEQQALQAQLQTQQAVQTNLQTRLRTRLRTRTRTRTRARTRTRTRTLTRTMAPAVPLRLTMPLRIPALPPLPPFLPSSERGPEGAAPQRNLKVVGFNRGIFDTSVDLETGATRTEDDIPGVPEDTVGPYRLAFGPERGQSRTVPWGALSLHVKPDGSFAFTKAGKPRPPDSEFRPAREFGNAKQESPEVTLNDPGLRAAPGRAGRTNRPRVRGRKL